MKKREDTRFDVFEMRRILEVAAAGYAAERRTDADLDSIKKRFDELNDAYAAQEADSIREVEADVAFHLASADASHNMALMHVMRSMIDLLRTDISLNIHRLRQREEDHEPLRAQHSRIFEAIVDGDADKARYVANCHLDFIEQKLREHIDHQKREVRAKRRLHQ